MPTTDKAIKKLQKEITDKRSKALEEYKAMLEEVIKFCKEQNRDPKEFLTQLFKRKLK